MQLQINSCGAGGFYSCRDRGSMAVEPGLFLTGGSLPFLEKSVSMIPSVFSVNNWKSKIMALKASHKIALGVSFVLVFLSMGFWQFSRGYLMGAQASLAARQTFVDPGRRFFMSYPSGWSMKPGYDRYAQGLMNIDLNNGRCLSFAGSCAADCVDLRILAGSKSESGTSSDLKGQLFTQSEVIKNSGNADLVEIMDIAGKKVYKIKSEAPTRSLTGACSGPLYLIDADADRYVYVFAGMGGNAKEAGGKVIEEILTSIVEGK